MLSNRILILLIGSGLSYLAVYAGSSLHNYIFYSQVAYAGILFVFALLVVIASPIGAIAAFIGSCQSLMESVDNEEEQSITLAMISFVLMSFFFGTMFEPFVQYGGEPWNWQSPWMLILALDAIPLIFILKGILVDFLELLMEQAGAIRARFSSPPQKSE